MIAVRHRAAALVSTVLAIATATLALPAPASAVEPDLSVQITQPKIFTVGAGAGTLTAVVSSQQQGRACRKVRWSMLLRVQGVRLDQVNVERIESGQQFGVRARTDADQARLTDVQFDPGSLCPGGTVTATYLVAFAGGKGTATFQVDALDAAGRVLQSATSSSRVEAKAAADPARSDPATPPASRTEEPSADPSPSPSASDDAGGVAAADDQTAAPGAGQAAAQVQQNKTSAKGGTPSLLGPGLIVGAVLVFLGVGLLLRLRSRSRGLKNQRNLTPTSFYPAPYN
jgi:hypothetical protein